MITLSHTAAIGVLLATMAVAPAVAGPQPVNLEVGHKVFKAQLGIQGPKTKLCPNEAKVTGWVYTNYPGKVTVMFARKGQGVGQPIQLQTQKAPNGQYVAIYSRTIDILNPINAEYRLLVGGGSGVVSSWVPLKASCSIGMPQGAKS